jgi:hypothetical protein
VSEILESLCRDGAVVQEKALLQERVAFRLPEAVVANPL